VGEAVLRYVRIPRLLGEDKPVTSTDGVAGVREEVLGLHNSVLQLLEDFEDVRGRVALVPVRVVVGLKGLRSEALG
jgi:hypothetical protein